MRPLLRKVFGIQHLRAGQDDVIHHIMAGHDTLALMATGAGKSLCYQLPALMLPGCTLVISPLIALMKDQCDKLRAMGVAAVQLNSGLLAVEREKAEEAVREGRAKIIMSTPEHLHEPGFVRDLARHPVSLLVIDEAHCIAEWGHDFRPAFLEIGMAHQRLGKPVVLALTATATEGAIQEVMQQLDLPDMQVINTGLYRPNLHYAVDHVTSDDSKVARLLTLVKAHEGQGMVYTSTVKAAEEVHAILTQAGEAAALYHGHLAAGRRRDSQEAYMRGEARLMVATQAFGMGVDKADTRFVIHYQLPASLEAYYQESGRAGRDGQPADGILLYLPRDRAIQQFFLSGRYPGVEDLLAVHALLASTPVEAAGWTLPTVIDACDRPRTKVQLAVLLMRKQGVLSQNAAGRLRLKSMQMDVPDAQALLESYVARKAQDRAMLEAMVLYAQSGQCRWQMLLQHFDQDAGFTRCGHCDNCLRMAQAQADVAALAQSDQQAAQAPRPPDETPLPQIGDAVTVPRYGRGRVLAIDSLGITVSFPNGPDRSFLPRYVRPVPSRRRAGHVAE